MRARNVSKTRHTAGKEMLASQVPAYVVDAGVCAQSSSRRGQAVAMLRVPVCGKVGDSRRSRLHIFSMTCM
jgi:hypothetical protein